ncbi:Cyclic di-GMP phosphodiesterase PdeR [bioreactor metagenome]|uniref:Cyclic di-GMP phosphodiesterase PdeR n=1 Tax=bioreactor metagenome TaxID=1076179 RepID=A0A645IAR6_9ZZZZ
MVLLRAVDSESGALAVADKIRVALGQPVCVGEHRLGVSASIGVAMFPAHGEDDLALTQHADIAMYEAKARGGDAVYVFRAGEAGVA